MNILVDSNIVLLKESLVDEFDVISYDGGELTKSLIQESGAEILFVRSTSKCNENLLDGTKVKFLATATAGIDNLDLDFLHRSGIKWANAPGSNSISVAEFVTLAIQHWCIANKQAIENQTLGIVGYGNVGKKVARIFENYCKSILVYDPFLEQVQTEKIRFCNYNHLLEQSSIITFHVPLSKDGAYPTYNMLAYEQLATLDNAKLIINMARGGVVNQSDLKDVKYPPNNLIFDVWENEPNIDILFAQSLFFATPHIAGHSYEGKLRGTLNMLEVLEIYLSRKIDKTRVLNGINNSQKHHLSELSFKNLFELLDSNIKIVGTSEEFKNSLESFEETNFNKIRKNYRKHNESLSEKSFE